MADSANKVELNVDGAWYVDSECIDCDLCRSTAPDNFKSNEDEGYAYVYKQPEGDDQKEKVEQAKEDCPVEAIGNDG